MIPKEGQKESASFLIIKQIQAIYREEGKLKELSSEERLVQRQVVVKPLVDALFVYLKQHESEVGTEKLREAFTYALNQEKYLRVFLTDGDVPMDNKRIRACDPRILCRQEKLADDRYHQWCKIIRYHLQHCRDSKSEPFKAI